MTRCRWMLQKLAYEVAQVPDTYQAAPIANRGKGHGAAAVDPAKQTQEIGTHPRSVNQRRADDHDLEGAGGSRLLQELLSLPFGICVGILRPGRIVGCERPLPGNLAIHLDGAEIDEAAHTGLQSLGPQTLRAVGVGLRVPLGRAAVLV